MEKHGLISMGNSLKHFIWEADNVLKEVSYDVGGTTDDALMKVSSDAKEVTDDAEPTLLLLVECTS